MKTDEFDYHLPKSLIAQHPAPQRDQSRLMVVYRNSGRIEHRSFQEIHRCFSPGDLLIINNTRVLPVRLVGRKETGGRCELLLLPQWNGAKGEWKALVKGIRDTGKGARILFEQGLEAEVTEIRDGAARVRFSDPENVIDILKRVGHIPLPPYIKRPDEPSDRDRYQTIFAERDGSIAAPTAGLHFTEQMLRLIKENGVGIASITLHVGPGTFRPLKSERVEDHVMESEWTEISHETSREIEQTKQRGGRVIAVGTTTTRALESFSDSSGKVKHGANYSSLFIYPPYSFRVVDGMVTNFHLPKSTLVMLVSAFGGKDHLMRAYQEAVREKYRFYSYGDAMLIL